MRFDTPIYFQKTASIYNAETGNYDDAASTKALRYASITDTRTDTLNLVYGEIKQGALTVRIQGHYESSFDCIYIGSKKYRVDYFRRLRNKEVFVVSEVQ